MSTAPSELQRYGHSSHVIDGVLYVFGGFNGKMLSDVWKMIPGKLIEKN